MTRHDPPRLAERLLRWWLPTGVVGDSILGDAREEFAEYVRGKGRWPASLWYWMHAARIAVYYVRDSSSEGSDRIEQAPPSPAERLSALLGGIRRAARRGGEVDFGTVLKDLRFGARSLMRDPASALVSVVVLSMGIGLSTFMFSLVYGVLYRGLDVPAAEELVMLYRQDVTRPPDFTYRWASQDFEAIRERSTSFEGIAGYWDGTVNVAGNEAPERFDGVFVTANMFEVLQYQPILGRGFLPGEDAPGAAPNVVLGYDVWQDRFGGDPGVLGTVLRVNGRQGEVVGVMPEGFMFPTEGELYVVQEMDATTTERWQGSFYNAIGRLADGVDRDRAQNELVSIARQLADEYPETNENMSATTQTFVEAYTGPQLQTLFMAMMVAVLLVLLVACANVANLLLARATLRTKEAAVRTAMGAGRIRVMLPFFSEALVLAAIGAVVGTGIAYLGVQAFDQATNMALTGRPYFMQFRIDLPILAFVVGLTGLTALVAGAAPALQVSKADVNGVLKDESRGSSSFHMTRLTGFLVIVEVAFSCALLVGAGLMTKSILQFRNYELPFDDSAYFTARVGLFEADYPEAEDRQAFWDELHRRLNASPRVTAAAISSGVPGGGTGMMRVEIEGETYADPAERPDVHNMIVTPNFFDVMGVDLIEGERFDDSHTLDSELVVIVNQSMARSHWPDGALGRRIRWGSAEDAPWARVIGVVPDMEMESFQSERMPGGQPDGFYMAAAQRDLRFMSIVALPAGVPDPMGITADVRELVRGIDPNLPIYDAFPISEVIFRNTWFYNVFGTIFILFGAAALFMASVGLYGVLAFSVTRRVQEMGIRMALGAGARDVLGLVMRQGIKQLTVGLAIGVVLAWAVSQVVGILMYEVDPRDPVVFLGVVGLIVVVSLLASFVPARRATGVDPMVALRYE